MCELGVENSESDPELVLVVLFIISDYVRSKGNT